MITEYVNIYQTVGLPSQKYDISPTPNKISVLSSQISPLDSNNPLDKEIIDLNKEIENLISARDFFTSIRKKDIAIGVAIIVASVIATALMITGLVFLVIYCGPPFGLMIAIVSMLIILPTLSFGPAGGIIWIMSDNLTKKIHSEIELVCKYIKKHTYHCGGIDKLSIPKVIEKYDIKILKIKNKIRNLCKYKLAEEEIKNHFNTSFINPKEEVFPKVLLHTINEFTLLLILKEKEKTEELSEN